MGSMQTVDLSDGLWIVVDHFGRGLYHFELDAHLLDLRGLLFQLSRENLHPLLLLSDC
jgi:hypothetical protein